MVISGSSRTPPKIGTLTWILGGIGLFLLCTALTAGLLAVRALHNAGLSFRFDAAGKALLVIGSDGKEVTKPDTRSRGDLDEAQNRVLFVWLSRHRWYRRALDADCACAGCFD